MRYEGVDRRRYHRSNRGFQIVEDEGGPGVLNHVDNISPTGVLFHTVKPVPLMTKLGMALVLPGLDGRRLECEGIVVRCDPHESGDDHFKVAILFVKIDEEDQEAVRQFVEHDLGMAPPEED